jgi:hypothetical protein
MHKPKEKKIISSFVLVSLGQAQKWSFTANLTGDFIRKIKENSARSNKVAQKSRIKSASQFFYLKLDTG